MSKEMRKPLEWKDREYNAGPNAFVSTARDGKDIYEIGRGYRNFNVIKNYLLWFDVCETLEAAKYSAEREAYLGKWFSENSDEKTKIALATQRETSYTNRIIEGKLKGPSGLSSLVVRQTAKEQIMAKTTTSVTPKTPKDSKDAKAPKEPKTPKETTSATAEEIDAAVRGELKPRKQLGDKKQESLSKTDEKGRPSGRPLGVTTGFPILLAWCYAFQTNEKAPKKAKLTDEGITEFMKDEFPGRATPAFDHPASCRRDYNTGKFTKGTKPKVQSNRYDENGEVTTARGGGKKKEEKEEAEATEAKPAKKAVKAAA